MLKHSSQLFVATTMAIAATIAFAQDGPQDPMSKFIWDMFKLHDGKTLCSNGTNSVSKIRADVVQELKARGVTNEVTPEAVATALWTRYPCPFSSNRPELLPASAKDVEGVWLFPEASQKFRYGPKSERQYPLGQMPAKCDAVGYYPNGELRHAMIIGRQDCPFNKASDLDIARSNPRVSEWKMLRDGRLSVTRTDVENHIEEWDVFTVVSPFKFYNMQLDVGDLVAYVRRENGNEMNTATQFRHLKRLP